MSVKAGESSFDAAALSSALRDPERLRALASTGLLDTGPEEAFDRLTRLASRLLHAPIALVSLLDHRRQFLKSALGLGEPYHSGSDANLRDSVCKHALVNGDDLIVQDFIQHEQLSQNPATRGLRAYAGIPLKVGSQQSVGVLCVMDVKPRDWSDEELATLRDLAAIAMTEMELRRTVNEYRRSEALYRSLVEHMPNSSVLLFDRNLVYRVADGSQLLATVGLTKEKIEGRRMQEVASPANRLAVQRMYEETLKGFSQDLEVERNGQTFALHTIPLKDGPGGEITSGMVFMYRLTEQKQLEQRLRDQSLLLKTVLDSMSEAVVAVGPDAKVILMNRASEVMFDQPEWDQPIHEWNPRLHLHRDDHSPPLTPDELPLSRALRGQEILQEELYGVDEDGKGSWHSVNASPLKDARGNPGGALVVIRDSTSAHLAQRDAEEHSLYLLLLSMTAAEANKAPNSRVAFQKCMELVCFQMDYVVGHLLERDSKTDSLVSTDLWHVEGPGYEPLQRQSVGMRFAAGEGIPGKVLQLGTPQWTENAASDPLFLRRESARQAGIHGAFFFPIFVQDEVVAALEFFSVRQERPGARLLEVMASVGVQLGRVVERERHAARVEALSITDELTGLSNRRGFIALATQQLKMAVRNGTSCVLVFVDLDGLKTINDLQGHAAGDAAIQEAAGVLRAAFRSVDVVARLGGDEFVVLAIDADLSSQARLLERLHTRVDAWNAQPMRPFALSLSAGVTAFDPRANPSIETLLTQADQQMYAQKQARRLDRANPR